MFGASFGILAKAYTQAEKMIDWSIEASKENFYPGEPVLLTLKTWNTTSQEVKIDFGADGIGAFSMEIHDPNGIVAKADRIQRFGPTRIGDIAVPANGLHQKSIVLNQWCSTLLPPGQYHIICQVEYKLLLETQSYRAIPFRKIKLELDIQIVKMDESEFGNIVKGLADQAFKKNCRTTQELADQYIAQEMLGFTESDMAISYQLQILKLPISSRLKRDVIDSLMRSKTVEAAAGLVQIAENSKDWQIEDIKRAIIGAIRKLRQTGKQDIMDTTDEFAKKHNLLQANKTE